jgi:hypothetical protein
MNRSRIALALAGLLSIGIAQGLHADVRTEQKTKFQLAGVLGRVVNVFGGRAAREGVTSTVALKGDRKVTMNDSTGQIIDLAEEKVYDLDLKKKSYKMTTFAELRRQMEEAQKRAAEDAKKAQRETKESKPAEKDPNAKEVEVDFNIKNTGQTKTVNGFNTHQSIVTVTVREKGKTLEQSGGLVMTSDMWLAPRIPEMKELQDFDLRYAQKLYGPMITGASAQDMATVVAMYPQVKQAMAKMNAEGNKIEGTPILTTMTFDAVKSAEQMAEEAKSGGDSGGSSAPPTSVGGLLGGLARRGAAKKDKDEAPSNRATIATTTSELLKLTTDVSADAVAIPAGFKESK